MIERIHDYVSVEIAKKINQKNYSYLSDLVYKTDEDKYIDTSVDNDSYNHRLTIFELEDNDVLIPDLYYVQKWLELKNIIVTVQYHTDDYMFYPHIVLLSSDKKVYGEFDLPGQFDTNEAALNNGIEYIITNHYNKL